jgi:Ca2+-binding EF-hand superfamily protein
MSQVIDPVSRSPRPALWTSFVGLALLLSGCSYQRNFKFADTSKDGLVSQHEFERYMLESIYSEADTNGDSKITWTEWKTANPSADERKFRAPDTNRDKAITPTEAKAHFAKQGTLDDLFNQMDTGKDGQLDKLEVKQFKETLEAQSGSTPLERLSQAAE